MIFIVDFGSQFAHLLSKQVRKFGVETKIIYPKDVLFEIDKYSPNGIILSGGPVSVNEKDSTNIDKKIFDLGIPILGICYGHQLIAHQLGGKIKKGKNQEYGKTTLDINIKNELFNNLPKKQIVWMSHWDEVLSLPEGFISVGKTKYGDNPIIINKKKKIYGLQCHIEVTHTEYGEKILNNFLDICKEKYNYNIENILEKIKNEILYQVRDKNIFMFVSGGVDSTVAFVLLNKILSQKRVFGLHVDNGFMRKNESKEVKSIINIYSLI